MTKISEYPEWYWHLSKSNDTINNLDLAVSDRIMSALNWGDIWSVFEKTLDQCYPWVVAVWGSTYIISEWQSGVHKCPN